MKKKQTHGYRNQTSKVATEGKWKGAIQEEGIKTFFFTMYSKAWSLKRKIDKLDFIKLKPFSM